MSLAVLMQIKMENQLLADRRDTEKLKWQKKIRARCTIRTCVRVLKYSEEQISPVASNLPNLADGIYANAILYIF